MAKYEIKFTTYGKDALELIGGRLFGRKVSKELVIDFYSPWGAAKNGQFKSKKIANAVAKKIDTLGRNGHFCGQFVAADVVKV